MSEELKPCPFCGKEPLVHRVPGMGRCYRVTCKFCDAGPHSALSETDAIATWNTRNTPSQGLDAATVEREGEWRPIEIEALRKGLRRSPKYYPAIGETCRMSGPNCDNDQGYTWADVEVLWRDDLFIVTRTPGCWATVTKLELALFEPALAALNAPTGAVEKGEAK